MLSLKMAVAEKNSAAAADGRQRLLWLMAALVVLAPVLAYMDSVGNGFAFDDVYVLERNPHVRDIGNIPGYFVSSSTQASYDMKTYRPLRQAMFTVEYRLFGLGPAGYHAVNVLNHAVNSALLFFFLRLVGLGEGCSLMAALLFSVHPVNTEAVANITGRTDTLFFLFYISGLVLYLKADLRSDRRKIFLAGSLAAYALSLLSKEMAFTFPAAVLLLDLLLRRSAREKSPFYLAMLMVSAGYLALRWSALGEVGKGEYYGDSFLTTMLSQCEIFMRYIGLAFVPWPLSARYDIALRESLLDPYVISFLLMAGVLLAASVRAALRKDLPLWLFGALWFFVTLLPVSNAIPIRAAMMGERYLYLPLVGLLVSVFSVGRGLYARSKPMGRGLVALCLAAFVVFFSLTVSRNPVWKDDITLFEDARAKAPDSLVVHWTLFEEYQKRGEAGKAQAEYGEMQRINTLAATRHLAVAERHLAEGRVADAERMARKALRTRPGMAEAEEFLQRLGEEAGR